MGEKRAAFYFRFKTAAFSPNFAGLWAKFDKKFQVFSKKLQ